MHKIFKIFKSSFYTNSKFSKSFLKTSLTYEKNLNFKKLFFIEIQSYLETNFSKIII